VSTITTAVTQALLGSIVADRTAEHRMRTLLRLSLIAGIVILASPPASAIKFAESPLSQEIHCELHGQAFYTGGLLSPANEPTQAIGRAAAQTPPWRSIAIGGYDSVPRLREALHQKRCRIGPVVAEIMDHPAFTISRTRMRLELVTLSVAELGLADKNASLAEIYARAQKLGFELCPAEIAPLLRLHYMNQPLGEFLHIAMAPIPTRSGRPVILVVANGGEGLHLLSSDGGRDLRPPASTRFVFVRAQAVAAR
jgi:hypothetical protein